MYRIGFTPMGQGSIVPDLDFLSARKQTNDGAPDRRVGVRSSGDLFVPLAALSSPGYRPIDGQPSRIFQPVA
jgi:hypothetical protein